MVSDSLYHHPLEHKNSFYFMTAFTDFGDSAESCHFYNIIENPLTLQQNTFFDYLTPIPKYECPYIQELLATTASRARTAMEQNDFATLPSSPRTTKQTSTHCVMTSRPTVSSDSNALTASVSYWRISSKLRYSTDFERTAFYSLCSSLIPLEMVTLGRMASKTPEERLLKSQKR
jgi:hypothetical protein